MLGMIDDLAPKISHEEILEEIYKMHCYASAYVWGSYILMCDIESLLTHAVVAMVLQILCSLGNHKVFEG